MQNKRARRNQKTYMCTGGHVDPTRPTTLKVGYRPNHNRSFADDEEEKDSKQSPSKSPLKKKTRRPPAMSSVDSDDDEDDGEEHSQPICDPRRLFANEEQQCDDDENEDGIARDVSQSASPTVMPCVTFGKLNYVLQL